MSPEREIALEIALTACACRITGKAVGVIFLAAQSPEMKGCAGYFTQVKKNRGLIALANNLTDEGIFNTFCHEIAHAILHGDSIRADVKPIHLKRYSPAWVEAAARLKEAQAENLAGQLRQAVKGGNLFERIQRLARVKVA